MFDIINWICFFKEWERKVLFSFGKESKLKKEKKKKF